MCIRQPRAPLSVYFCLYGVSCSRLEHEKRGESCHAVRAVLTPRPNVLPNLVYIDRLPSKLTPRSHPTELGTLHKEHNMTARPEGCGVVPVSTNQRQMDSRIYSPAQCVGQLAENAAAKGSRFNATEFNVAILSQFETSTRAKETDVGLPSSTLALKVLDNGVGFLYEEVEDMLTYGTPDKVTTEKKFGELPSSN